MKLSQLSEHQIRKAQAEGQLDNLKGAGKPLPPPGHGDFAEEASFRIMAEAGALSQDVELRKALKAQAQKLAQTTDPEDRKREMAVFAEIQQKLAIQEEARRKFYSTR
ncbi:DnaJ family domain-containing protein [Actibacterium sp. D379-3]